MFPILPLLLEVRLGTKVARYFLSSYSKRTEGYKWDEELEKVIPTRTYNYLGEIDRYWIQHIYSYDTRNKHYKEEDYGGYTINVGSFDIAGALGRPHLTEDGNESLLLMRMQKNYGDTNAI